MPKPPLEQRWIVRSPAPAAELSREMIVREFIVRADTINEAERTVEAVLATEDPVTAFDMRTWEPVDEVLRMDGWEPTDQIVLLDSHPQLGGRITTEDVRGSGRNLRTSSDQFLGKLYFADDEASLRMWGKVRDKHVRDLSIGAVPLEQVEIPPGQTQIVGGKRYTAKPGRKLLITVRWRSGEVSVTPRGADPRAKLRQDAAALTPHALRTDPMNELLRAYLETIGLAKGASEAAANEFLLRLSGDQLGEATRLRTAVTPPPAPGGATGGGAGGAGTPAPEIVRTGNPPAPAPQPAAAPAGQPTLEMVRAEAAAGERARIARIHELGGNDVPAELVRSAVDQGWDENRASREFLGAIRTGRAPASSGQGPAIHSRSHEGDCTVRAMTAGMMIRLGTRMIDPRASDAVRAQQEREAEQGDRYRDWSLIDVCREAIRLQGLTVPNGRDELIRTAVSTASFNAIFTNNVNARLLEAYMEITDTTADWCREADVSSFKVNERMWLGKTGMFEKLPRGGTANDATISDNVESYKIARYAKKFAVDDQDIIDDNYGAIQFIPTEMGNAAGRLRPNLVYAILLSNPNLSDGVPLFHATHGNLGTGAGSALSVTSLAAAIVAMAKQTQDGITLNINPRFLLEPQDLRWTGQQLLRAAEIRDTTASTKYATYNPLQDTDLVPRVDNRLGVAGVIDPQTGIAYPGTATNWFLAAAANEAKTIEVGYLAGTGRRPQVRPYILTEGRYGIGWDVKMDIGGKALDYRGFYKAVGA